MRNILWVLGAAISLRMSNAFLSTPARATALVVGGQTTRGVPCTSITSRPLTTAIARVVATSALMAKKRGRGGVRNEGAKPRERKEKDDVIEVEGVVKEGLPGATFRVEVSNSEQILLCTISGKIRKNFVRILVGDPVRVELSPYDLTRGRITFRYKK